MPITNEGLPRGIAAIAWMFTSLGTGKILSVLIFIVMARPFTACLPLMHYL